AVAAQLEADILLVDEVLAVRDAAFQVQCYERIAELRREGTTLLFISHDLASVDRLCDRVLLMNRGRLVGAGSASEVIGQYQQLVTDSFAADTADASAVATTGAARVLDVRFLDEQGAEVLGTCTGGALRAFVEIDVPSPVQR